MPASCSAVNCSNRWFKEESGPNRSFFKFPLTNPDLTKKWVKAMRRDKWTPTKSSALCSDHFTEKNFRIVNERRYLHPNTVPSVFKFPDWPCQKKSKMPRSDKKKRDQLHNCNRRTITPSVMMSKVNHELDTSPPGNLKQLYKPVTKRIFKLERSSPDGHVEITEVPCEPASKEEIKEPAASLHRSIRLVKQTSDKLFSKLLRKVKPNLAPESICKLKRRSIKVSRQRSKSPLESATENVRKSARRTICNQKWLSESQQPANQRAKFKLRLNPTKSSKRKKPAKGPSTTKAKYCPSQRPSNYKHKLLAPPLPIDEDLTPDVIAETFPPNTKVSQPDFGLIVPDSKLTTQASTVSVSKDHNYVLPSCSKLKRMYDQRNQQCQELRKNLRAAKQDARRQQEKCQKLRKVSTELRKQLYEKKPNFTDQCFDGVLKDLLLNHLKEGKSSQYPDNVKLFARGLYYQSPRAYKFVRKFIKLPSCSTIRHWASESGELNIKAEIDSGASNNNTEFADYALPCEPSCTQIETPEAANTIQVLLYDCQIVNDDLLMV